MKQINFFKLSIHARRLGNRGIVHWAAPLAVILLVAITGTAMLVGSHANSRTAHRAQKPSYGQIEVKSYINDRALPGVADVAVSGTHVTIDPACDYSNATTTPNTFHGCKAKQKVRVAVQELCVRDPRDGTYAYLKSKAKRITVKAGKTTTVNFIYGPSKCSADGTPPPLPKCIGPDC